MSAARHPLRGPAKWGAIIVMALILSGVAAWMLSRPSPPSGFVSLRIDLNRANRAELELIPGIGPVLAERIVARRAADGPLRSLDDLAAIPGFDASRIEALRDHAVVR